MAKIAFIGLGVMGFPMAGHLANAGHDVCVYNRTAQKAERWVEKYKGSSAPTPAKAAEGAEFVFTCVGNDDDLLEVTTGAQGVLSTMQPGSLLIDHTTASAEVARKLDGLTRQQSLGFLDAPVSGGQAGAENGALSVMVGGTAADYARAESVLQAYARSQKLLGPAGSGQLAKMVNQIAIAGLVQGLAEAVHFVHQSGLDGEAVFDVIQHGAAGSWQMINRHKTMLKGEYDFGFAVDWMRKDLQIALSEARRNGARLPVTALVDQFYADIQANGGGRLDTSSLLKRLEKEG
ncbi:NAD(P)-dependent oxidoreductase [Marinobacterium sediminicola]|uniref:NAD-binding of NADP-dependent 3-hydroxyisobutyrate dehydrogenase n=1 Tax=Marinobacterium sediminicola TaxID=518898 RepID=A0ABY1RXM9_9GAMM|nr:NAD(P)-dependent oxidoreductase [Marinobacterium sediminicola]ULG70753.1 NAD(P)-dependent oxidoreductase [Marinobacterium sediminicola]SMR71679.1 NAD-binding of NADP-dependent 3-hydroxyisobutyrate dehydrogenase [Marinobacterium sediminicola]